MRHILVILVAHELHQLPFGSECRVELNGEGLLIGAGIDNCDNLLQGRKIGPSVTLDRVKLLRVRVALEIKPGPFIEADGIDDQRIVFPMPDGVSIPRRVRRQGLPNAL